MPVTFEQGRPQSGGQAVVVVAVELALGDGTARTRTAVRQAAEAGFSGVWLRDAAEPDAVVAKDAARRAGLAVVVPALAFAAEPHVAVIADEPTFGHAEDPGSAFGHLFAGARVIYGDEGAVDGLRAYLSLTTEPAAWAPLDAGTGWQRRGSGAEQGVFGSAGGELELTVPEATAWAVHFVDPADGTVQGLVTPEGGESYLFRLPAGKPQALYVGPNRFRPDDGVVRPE